MVKKYGVSPYKKIKYGGMLRGWITFPSRRQATNFIKKRRLRHALVYKEK